METVRFRSPTLLADTLADLLVDFFIFMPLSGIGLSCTDDADNFVALGEGYQKESSGDRVPDDDFSVFNVRMIRIIKD